MADQNREATLRFGAADVDRFLSDLDRIEAKLARIQSLTTSLTGGTSKDVTGILRAAGGGAGAYGAGNAAPQMPTYSYATSPTPGGGATMSAAYNPSIPMVGGGTPTPQQLQSGSARASQGNAGTMQQGGVPPTGGGGGIGSYYTYSPYMNAALSGFPGGLGAFGPGAYGALRFMPNPLAMGAGAAAAMIGAYTWNDYQVSIQRAVATAGGQNILPEQREAWDWQRVLGWTGPIGGGILQAQQARLNMAGQYHQVQGRLTNIGGDPIRDMLYSRRWMYGRGAARGASWIQEFPIGGAAEQIGALNEYGDIFPAAFGRSGGARDMLSFIGAARRRDPYNFRNALRSIGSYLGSEDMTFARIGVNAGGSIYDAFSATGDVAAATGNLSAMQAISYFGAPAGGMDIAVGQANRTARAGLFGVAGASGRARLGALRAAGYTGYAAFDQGRMNAAISGQRADILGDRLDVATATLARNPNNLDLMRVVNQYQAEYYNARGEAYSTAREAGEGLFGYKMTTLGSRQAMETAYGGSGAHWLRRQGQVVESMLRRPGDYYGPGVRLTDEQYWGLRAQARQLRVGAIEAEHGWTQQSLGYGQSAGESMISGMQASGAMWGPRMESAFGSVASFVQARIADIDRKIQQYAAIGISQDTPMMRGAMAESAQLRAGLEHVRAQAFTTKYQLLGVPYQTTGAVGGAMAGAAMTLGNPAQLAGSFGLMRQAAGGQLALAQQMYSQAVAEGRPMQAMQAMQMMAAAQSQVATLPLQQVEATYGLAMRVPQAMGAAYSTMASWQSAAFGTTTALPALMGGVGEAQNLAALAGRRYAAVLATPGVGLAVKAEAFGQYQSAVGGAAGAWLSLSNFQQRPELIESISQAEYGQNILSSTFGSRGSVRAMARQRMSGYQQSVEELVSYRDRVLPSVPAPLRSAFMHNINNQLRQAGMGMVGAQQELEQGWLERVVSSYINMPDNASLVLNNFSMMGSVMRGGARARHLGATASDLLRYQEDPMRYYSYGGAGKFGTTAGFLSSALAGVTETTAPSYFAPLSGAPGVGSPSAPGVPETHIIKLEVVIRSDDGNVLGTMQRTLGPNDSHIFFNPYAEGGRGQY